MLSNTTSLEWSIHLGVTLLDVSTRLIEAAMLNAQLEQQSPQTNHRFALLFFLINTFQ